MPYVVRHISFRKVYLKEKFYHKTGKFWEGKMDGVDRIKDVLQWANYSR